MARFFKKSPFRPKREFRDVWGVKIGVFRHGESIFEVSRPPRPHLVAKKCEKHVFWAKLCPPVISESKQVGIFCLFTKLFIYVISTTFVFKKFFFYLFNFFRVAMGAKITINSSLRSKNFWISIFFCTRNLIQLVNAHKKFKPISAKNGPEIANFS